VESNTLTFFLVEGEWDNSLLNFNQGLSHAASLPWGFPGPETPLVKSMWLYLAVSYMHTHIHTHRTWSPVVRHWEARSGISFINLTVLVGDLESVWPQKETALSLTSTNITVFLECLCVSSVQIHTKNRPHKLTDKQISTQQHTHRQMVW